jgi:Na+-transporting NADH:ubiquinone oxidoreductase subunit NqrE
MKYNLSNYLKKFLPLIWVKCIILASFNFFQKLGCYSALDNKGKSIPGCVWF